MKQEGDFEFFHGRYEDAKEKYTEALKLDPTNEYAVANLGVIHLKRNEYDKCIEYSTQALQIIEYFMNDTKSFSRDNKLEVKLLLRRGKSYEMKGDYEKAKTDLDRTLSLEP